MTLSLLGAPQPMSMRQALVSLLRRLLETGGRLQEAGALPDDADMPDTDAGDAGGPAIYLSIEQGQVRAVLLQPIGPPDESGRRPLLHLDFMLQPDGEPG